MNMNMNIKLEQLQKAIDDAREEIQKASDAWATYDATYGAAYDTACEAYAAAVYVADTYDAACEAYNKAIQELEDYKKEHGL